MCARRPKLAGFTVLALALLAGLQQGSHAEPPARGEQYVFSQNITLLNAEGLASDRLLRMPFGDSTVRLCSVFCVTHMVAPSECQSLLQHVQRAVGGDEHHESTKLLRTLVVGINNVETGATASGEAVVKVPVFPGAVKHALEVANTVCIYQSLDAEACDKLVVYFRREMLQTQLDHGTQLIARAKNEFAVAGISALNDISSNGGDGDANDNAGSAAALLNQVNST